MPRKSPRTDNSFNSEVKMLHEFGFDYADKNHIRYDSSKYRLIREPNNSTDANAVAVYISQIKVGYLEKAVAQFVAPAMDSGNVFSARHITSTRSSHYDEKYDNKRGDGYYRNLTVQVYNESAIAGATNRPLSEDVVSELKEIQVDPGLTNKYNDHHSVGPAGSMNPNGCGCLILIILGIAVPLLVTLRYLV